MHRRHAFSTKGYKGLKGLFWIHVHLPPARRVIGTNGHESEIDIEALSDFLKPLKGGTIATMKDRALAILNDVAAKAPMHIVNVAGTPVLGWGEGDLESIHLELVPPAQFHWLEIKLSDDPRASLGKENGLPIGHFLEGF